ncbi:MAG: helix-turn-helix transcriptional regulator [Rhodospirillales bacterium]|nr:helix-turn-helix transcriptional regulator [Rhodospirillales bacterium]
MNTREVADYLRIKERKVYDLVKQRCIPCTRVAGKWLFPKALIDAWLLDNAEGPEGAAVARMAPAPPTMAGSNDPLLEWALRESGCHLALMADGSLDGVERLAVGEAMVCGMHVHDAETDDYNVPIARRRLGDRGLVVLEWAWREQGLLLAAGNPLGVGSIADVARLGARLIWRQAEAGSFVLLSQLIARAGLGPEDFTVVPQRARSEMDVALAIREGKADAGLAVAAVARQLGLDFVPLGRERFDLVLWRRNYFEPQVQTLMAFCRSPALTARAHDLGGYDVSGFGRVIYNGP